MINSTTRVIHGGCLNKAVNTFGIARDQWLDLSTGINPQSYPLASPPEHIWRSLPEDDDGLVAAAQSYYGCRQLIMTPGSQWSIAKIPGWCRTLGNNKNTVLLPYLGYQEHRYAWQKSGFNCVYYMDEPTELQLSTCSAMVVINPNNPSGKILNKAQLLQWHNKLSATGAWLIVDEAFIDVDPSQSMVKDIGETGLIVLRSLGKFFGLAGGRIGSLLAWQPLLELVRSELEPWSIANPSRWAAKQALQDTVWQNTMRAQLIVESHKLACLLRDTFSKSIAVPVNGCALFQTVWIKDAEAIYQKLAREGILVRLLSEYKIPGLRFGLPADNETNRAHLTRALNELDYK